MPQRNKPVKAASMRKRKSKTTARKGKPAGKKQTAGKKRVYRTRDGKLIPRSKAKVGRALRKGARSVKVSM